MQTLPITGYDKKELVRQFSDEWSQAEPHVTLALGVAVASSGPDDPDEQRARFQSLYQKSEGDDLVKTAHDNLEESGAILRESWRRYLEEKNVDQKKSAGYAFEPAGDDVFAEFAIHIQSSVENWKSRKRAFGKAHNYFFSCCETLSNHSNFFSIIPSQNQYCALFCSVLKTLVKAGANHVELGKRLDETITSINDQVEMCRLDHSLMQTKDISALIMQLYAHVFRLLGLILRHFTSRRTRFFNALNENSFQNKFGEHVRHITSMTERIRKRAQLGNRAELRDMNVFARYNFSKLERQNDRMYEEIKQIKSDQNEQLKLFAAALQEIGKSGNRFLIQSNVPEFAEFQTLEEKRVDIDISHDRPATLVILSPKFPAPGETIDPCAESSLSVTKGKSERGLSWKPTSSHVEPDLPSVTETVPSTIRANAQYIESLLLRNPLHLLDDVLAQNPGIIPEPAVMAALQSWTSGQGPHILWFDGKNGNKQRDSFRLLAEVVVAKAQDFGIGALYFSCNPYSEEYEDGGDDSAKHQRCLLDLVYVLIWQILHVVPSQDQLHGVVESLDKVCNEDFGSLPGAVEILDNLLEISPHVSIIVIDGIETLSDPRIELDTEHVLNILFKYCERPKDIEEDEQAAGYAGGNLRNFGAGVRMVLTTVNTCQPLTTLRQQFEEEIAYEPVHWKRWHQYVLDVGLFDG